MREKQVDDIAELKFQSLTYNYSIFFSSSVFILLHFDLAASLGSCLLCILICIFAIWLHLYWNSWLRLAGLLQSMNDSSASEMTFLYSYSTQVGTDPESSPAPASCWGRWTLQPLADAGMEHIHKSLYDKEHKGMVVVYLCLGGSKLTAGKPV